ncbi:MAG: hypothetical protein ACKV2U_03260 [Bryobacteraceae bacterium]
MTRLLINHVQRLAPALANGPARAIAVLTGILLSAVVILSDSQWAVGGGLVLLTMVFLAFEAPAMLAPAESVEDDSE